MARRTVYMYAVSGAWGEVPDQIRDCVDNPERQLLYNEDRGPWFQQDFMRNYQPVGGWICDFVGIAEVEDGQLIRSSVRSS